MGTSWQANVLTALRGIASNLGGSPTSGFDWKENCLTALESIQANIGGSTGFQELYSDNAVSVPISSGDFLQIALEGVDTRNILVNAWTTVTPTPSATTSMTAQDEASGVTLISSSLQLTKTAGSSILSRLVTTAGAADYVPGVTWTAIGSPGISGNSYTLSGSGWSTTDVALPATGPWTLELYTSASSGAGTVIASQSVAGTKSNCSFILSVVGGGAVDFGWSHNGSSFSAITGSTSIAGVERHVAVTSDGSTVRLFVDGNLEASASQGGDIFASTRPLLLGGEQGSMSYAGTVRDFRFSTECLYTSTFTPADPLPGPTWTTSGYSTSSSSIDAVDVSTLDAVTITAVTPSTTTVRYAWSFDNGVTWEAYNGSAWAAVALADIDTNGMTAAQISSNLAAIQTRMIVTGAVTRLGYGLTTANGYSPTVAATITTSVDTEALAVAGVDYDLRRTDGAIQLRSTGAAFTCNLRVLG